MAAIGSGPTLKRERELFAEGYSLIVGMDEVGRGALGGPVTVGACAVLPSVGAVPVGLRDSKLLTVVAREKLVPVIGTWSHAYAVGDASSAEIDDLGIIAALRLAGNRALAGLGVTPDIILLDGSHDWLTPEPTDLFSDAVDFSIPVEMFVKADMSRASVAAASVVAKVHRDNLMRHFEQQYPGYGWADHVGYGTPGHRAAIAALGPSDGHRRSWKLTD